MYDRRLAIISGKAEPSNEEVEAGENAESDNDDDEAEGARVTDIPDEKDKKPEEMEGIPEFWLTAMKNGMAISETISDADEDVSAIVSWSAEVAHRTGVEEPYGHSAVVS